MPVGSCLSGGLDSSAVVGVIESLLRKGADTAAVGHTLRTFSVVFPGEPFDESRFVDAVAAHTEIDSHRVTLAPQGILETARPVVRQQDEPFGSTSMLAQWEVMRLARETGVTVLLDGQGGDELLGGYDAFVGFRAADLLRSGRVAAGLSELRSYQRLRATPWARVARLGAVPFVPGSMRRGLRRRDKVARTVLDSRLQGLDHEPIPAPPAGLDALSKERYRVYKHGLPALLRYEDRNSMAFAIEARLPFLDSRLVDLSFQLDPRSLISDGLTKQVLRTALADRLPPEVRTRSDKIGFETPQGRWLRADAAAIDAQLARPGFGGGYLDRRAAQKLVEQQRRNGLGVDFATWRCLCLDLWLEEVVEAGSSPAIV